MEAMNNLPDNEMNEVIRKALRGELTETEKRDFDQRLNLDAALRDEFELEQSLEQLLERLPTVSVSTNFTSLVLQSVQSEAKQLARAQKSWWRLPFPYARLTAGLAIVAAAGFLSIQQYRKSERQEMVRSVTSFTEVASAIGSEESPNLVFQDFDAIKRYSVPADSELDLELLVALQK
jgi:anti-sigma factor RsiW